MTFFLYYSEINAQDQKIVDLEQKISELEKRITRLESIILNSKSEEIEFSDKWKNKSLWRSLKTNMTTTQVEDILGIPKKIDGGSYSTWFYSDKEWHSIVSFYDGLLESWTEPR